MIKFIMTHAADIFGATLVFGPIVLGITLAIVSRRRSPRDPWENYGQPWLRTYDAHMRGGPQKRVHGKHPALGAPYGKEQTHDGHGVIGKGVSF